MAKSRIVKTKAHAAQASGRVVKAADRTSKSSAKAGKTYKASHLGGNC